jgi:cell wall-associated NlpC family hydrolase
MLLTVKTSTANILGNPETPNIITNNDSQLLYGEQFQVEKERGVYVYGHNILDGYKGFVERDQLAQDMPAANMVVNVRSTHLYQDPSFKSRPVKRMSFLSRLSVTETAQDGFIELKNGQWIFADHITTLKGFRMPDDMAHTAESIFLGTPYLYAGRSSYGIDCSGLIQQIMLAHGHNCPPRDAKDQENAFGQKIDNNQFQRNDIVYFKAHVGIMLDENRILNATARHMNTVIEDVHDLARIYNGITHVARV